MAATSKRFYSARHRNKFQLDLKVIINYSSVQMSKGIPSDQPARHQLRMLAYPKAKEAEDGREGRTLQIPFSHRSGPEMCEKSEG